jgi:hypothetical protein
MNEINWVYWPDPRSVTRKNNAQIVYPEYGQDANLIAYSRAYEKRKLKYPNFSPSNEATQIAMEIEEKGYTIIENYFPFAKQERKTFSRFLLICIVTAFLFLIVV